MLVVFVFLRNVWATLIPSIAVPLSLIGTFGVMYLLGYSVDNLSLMALAISTGFVVDDAIVVIENITRYLEQGMTPVQAALRGAKEIGFTVLSMSIVAGRGVHSHSVDGRHRRPFVPRVRGDAGDGDRRVAGGFADDDADDVREVPAVARHEQKHGWLYRASEAVFEWHAERLRAHACAGCCAIKLSMLLVTLATASSERLSVHHRAEGIFPAAGYRPLEGNIQAAPGHFVPAMQREA